MRKIRAAQIGMSTHGHSVQVFASMKKQSEIFDIVGYAIPEGQDVLPERAKVLEGYRRMTVEEILADDAIEAVIVESDERDLTRYALAAAKAGRHVHMEKPGGTDAAEFEALVRTVQASGKVFHTGYMYRYNPEVIRLLEQVRAGELGEIISVEAQMNCFLDDDNRRWMGAYPGGMMYWLGCHLIDLIVRIQGQPRSVLPLSRATGLGGIDSQDAGLALLSYPRGISIARTVAVERGGFLRRELVVTGSKGTVELRPLECYQDGGMYTFRRETFTTGWHTPGVDTRSPAFDRYDGMMAAFARMVRGETVNPYTPEYELALHRIILQCCGV